MTTLLYDRDCGFCRWCVAKVLAWDRGRNLRPLALQDPEAERLLAGMPGEARMASWHLVDEEGRVSSAGRGFAPLLRELPGGRPLADVAERVPGPLDRAYRFVADRRGTLGPLLSDGAKRRADRRIAARRAGGS